MKKTILFFGILFTFLLLFSGIANAFICDESTFTGELVPCGRTPSCRCELGHIGLLILNVYDYLRGIAYTIAGLGIVIGGIVIIFSAGNPNLATSGRRILWGSILGMVLIWISWIILHTVAFMLGVSPGVDIFTFPI